MDSPMQKLRTAIRRFLRSLRLPKPPPTNREYVWFMRVIGYWIRDLRDEEFCAPQEVVGDLAEGVREKIADYLEAGSNDVFNSQCGYSWCRFFCGIPHQKMGSKELTDGSWRWPEGLSHYVRAHGVILPEEFVEHSLGDKLHRRRTAARLPAGGGGASSDDPLDYWRKWCAAHRSGRLLERLRRARVEADARPRVVQQEEIQRRVSAEIAHYGLGNDRCIFAGCHERVLSGMKLCARHVLRDTDHFSSGCYAITAELLA